MNYKNTIKAVLLGDSYVGKTSLCKVSRILLIIYIKFNFNYNYNYNLTIIIN